MLGVSVGMQAKRGKAGHEGVEVVGIVGGKLRLYGLVTDMPLHVRNLNHLSLIFYSRIKPRMGIAALQ